MELPPLPRLDDKLGQCMRGPTEWSNWIIPGMLLCGPYPGALEDRRNDQRLKHILGKGVDTFVCLQDELDASIPEDAWRAGMGLRPYYFDAERLSKKQLQWVQLPIPDGFVAPDDVTAELVVLIAELLLSGRIVYLHCYGGHGRTGVFACLVLSYLYRISATEALKRVQAYHDCRIDPQGAKSPQTVVQREQVKRQVEAMLKSEAPDVTVKSSKLVNALDMDAAKRHSMKPMKKNLSCPELKAAPKTPASDDSGTPTMTRQRQLSLKDSVHAAAMPEYLALPSMPGASAKRRREMALKQKAAAAALRRAQFRKSPALDSVDFLMEFR
eukprot:TRINITY_DN33137_c0_g1_i1.p1 TRINITY_DN33137_c0_g1~~TRINITY_DN33137_c0_g1_i1.p1  ORF type:complete len:341 (-),score=72.98 TRINITY_DN33137_c0_g1_i1:311-1291(-)